MAASFASGVLLARMLGVEGYGYYGFAFSIITIGGIPGELGLPTLVLREIAAHDADGDPRHAERTLRWATRTALRLSGVIVLLLVAAAAAAFAADRRLLATAILFGAPAIPLMAIAKIDGGALQGLHHVVRGQVPPILFRPLLLTLLLLAAFLFNTGIGGAPGAMALYSLTSCFTLAAAHFWLRQRLPRTLSNEPVHGEKRWLATSIPFALVEGMRVLQGELSIVLLGLLASAAEVGIFRIATVTATMAAIGTIIVTYVTMPTIARLYSEREMPRLQKVVTAGAWIQFACVVVASIPLLVAAGPLLTLVFGSSYAVAAVALKIIAVGQIANAAFGPNVTLLNMTGHERRVTRAMAISLAVNLVGVAAVAGRWGATGAAAAYVAALLCWNVLTWLDARRLVGVETSILHWPRR
jgi:O-antigen/teichoic acid export membrane protein